MTTEMCKLSVREFGPIGEGCGDGWMEIGKCTLFIGSQGSGKSSVAKLIAEFSWLEKALLRGNVTLDELQRKDRFRKYYCAYHRLTSFFREGTFIRYFGRYHYFEYADGQFRVTPQRASVAGLPKITYVPAERNVLGIMEKGGMSRYFTDSLRAFWEAYEDARLSLKADLALPVDSVRFTYDRLNKIGWIKGDDYRTRLSESASGYQSLVPLFLVSRYVADFVRENVSGTGTDPEEYRRLQKEVEAIMSNKELTADVKTAALESLSSRFRYSHFVNVVEEPELNLFPKSQRDLLQELIGFVNERPGNKLVVTTHSPYILAALNNLMYAGRVGKRHRESVARVIPECYWIAPEAVNAYQLEGGRIVPIVDREIRQVEAERIDGVSEELNEQYEQLLKLDC